MISVGVLKNYDTVMWMLNVMNYWLAVAKSSCLIIN